MAARRGTFFFNGVDGPIPMHLESTLKRPFDYFTKKELIKFRGGEMGDILHQMHHASFLALQHCLFSWKLAVAKDN